MPQTGISFATRLAEAYRWKNAALFESHGTVAFGTMPAPARAGALAYADVVFVNAAPQHWQMQMLSGAMVP